MSQASILDTSLIERLENVVDNESPVIVEHRHYRGSRAPTRMVFDSAKDLRSYLQQSALPGDSIWFWRYEDVCKNENAVAWAKSPDASGGVPEGGAY